MFSETEKAWMRLRNQVKTLVLLVANFDALTVLLETSGQVSLGLSVKPNSDQPWIYPHLCPLEVFGFPIEPEGVIGGAC